MAQKPYQREEWLREQYYKNGLTLSEIGEKCGVTGTTIGDWMDRHGIERRDSIQAQQPDGKHTNFQWLKEQYQDKGRSMSDIGTECGVSSAIIHKWLHRFGIATRKAATHKKKEPARYYTDHEGYEIVTSKHKNQPKYARVHQLVAIAKGYDPKIVFSDGDWNCHHRNHIPWDNRPENIEVLDKSVHAEYHANDRDRTDTGEWV